MAGFEPSTARSKRSARGFSTRTTQEMRALLTARKLVQSKLLDVQMSLRGLLRGFGLKVGPTTPSRFAGRIRGTGRVQRNPGSHCGGARSGPRDPAARVRRLREAGAFDRTFGPTGALQVDGGETCRSHRRIEPLRHRASLQADPLKPEASPRNQAISASGSLAIFCSRINLARSVHHANARVFQ